MISGIGPVEESGPDQGSGPDQEFGADREAGADQDAGPRQKPGPDRRFGPAHKPGNPVLTLGRQILAPSHPPSQARSRLLGALALAAALTVTLTATPLRDGRPITPAPWPLSVTQLTYTGLREPPDPRTRTFTFHVRASLDAGPPTTLTRLAQPYDGLTMTINPHTPLTLRTGTPRTLTLQVAVRHCTGLPQGVELPFLNVTLRNMRGTQNPSYILGSHYARDLSSSLRAICR